MQVFENILAHDLHFFEDIQLSDDARNLIESLLTVDISERLGCKSGQGAQEVKRHPWFYAINWETLPYEGASFIPKTEQPDDTSYFDNRGLDDIGRTQEEKSELLSQQPKGNVEASILDGIGLDRTFLNELGEQNNAKNFLTKDNGEGFVPEENDVTKPGNEFGSFVYKNLALLEKANNDVVRRLKYDGVSMIPGSANLSKESIAVTSSSESISSIASSNVGQKPRHRSVPPTSRNRLTSAGNDETKGFASANSSSSLLKLPPTDNLRRNSMPEPEMRTRSSILHVASGKDIGSLNVSDIEKQQSEVVVENTHYANALDMPNRKEYMALIAEDNPLSARVLSYLLTKKFNCRCVLVRNGAEAIRFATGQMKFDIIFMNVHLPIISGDVASKMIRSVDNINRNTPIIGLTMQEAYQEADLDNYDEIMTKPINYSMLKHILDVFLEANEDGKPGIMSTVDLPAAVMQDPEQ
jgi:CheY-like chemotaxis protein